MAEHEVKDRIEDQIRAVIYGQCVGDALGLLTEFMPKKEAKSVSIFVQNIHIDHQNELS